MPFKVSRTQITEGVRRKDRPKKTKQSFNAKNPEVDDNSFTSTSAKKLKGDNKQHVPEEALIFSTLSVLYDVQTLLKEEVKKNFVMEK